MTASRLLMAALPSLLLGCGPPEDPGLWVPITVGAVASAGGFLYGGGTFKPRELENGDPGVMVLDAEALFLRDEDAVYPTKDVGRSQLREWSTNPSQLVGGGEGGLVAISAGPTLERLGLQNPKRPQRLDAGIDLAGLQGFTGLAQVSAEVSFLALGEAAQPRVALLRHRDGAHVESAVPLSACLPPAWAPASRLVALAGCGAPGGLEVLVLDASPADLRLGLRASRPAPQVRQPVGLGVSDDGTLIIVDRGAGGTAPAGLQLYRLDANDALTFLRFVPLPAGEAPQRAFVTGSRLVVFTARTALLIDPSSAAPEAVVRSQLTSFWGVLDVEPYASPGEPSAVLFALAMGEQGLGLLEVRGDELVHRGGFMHRWTDDAFSVKTSGKY